MMVLHSVFISVIVYIIMVYVLKQNYMIAETRSVFLGGIALLYMLMYGHSLPGKINKMLF
jgi:hypothetical protein